MADTIRVDIADVDDWGDCKELCEDNLELLRELFTISAKATTLFIRVIKKKPTCKNAADFVHVTPSDINCQDLFDGRDCGMCFNDHDSLGGLIVGNDGEALSRWILVEWV